MRIPAQQLARTSTRGKALHIVEWRYADPQGRLLSLCNDGLVLLTENGATPSSLPVCKLCLKAEEAIRATITIADIKVNQLAIDGLTLAQAIAAAMQHGVPHHAVITVEGGCTCCQDGDAVLRWYTPVGGDHEHP
jgi:hypothetical protein